MWDKIGPWSIITQVDTEINKKLLRLFRGERDGFIQAGPIHVEHFPQPREGKLQASFSRISFVVGSHDFIFNRLRLRCSANIHSIYNQSTEKIIDEDIDARVDLILPSNFLDELDDEGQKKRRNSLGENASSSSSFQVRLLLPIFFLVLR